MVALEQLRGIEDAPEIARGPEGPLASAEVVVVSRAVRLPVTVALRDL